MAAMEAGANRIKYLLFHFFPSVAIAKSKNKGKRKKGSNACRKKRVAVIRSRISTSRAKKPIIKRLIRTSNKSDGFLFFLESIKMMKKPDTEIPATMNPCITILEKEMS
jgi:hypothetical protein